MLSIQKSASHGWTASPSPLLSLISTGQPRYNEDVTIMRELNHSVSWGRNKEWYLTWYYHHVQRCQLYVRKHHKLSLPSTIFMLRWNTGNSSNKCLSFHVKVTDRSISLSLNVTMRRRLIVSLLRIIALHFPPSIQDRIPRPTTRKEFEVMWTSTPLVRFR